jgi:glyoxylase-like metal-dependent hydrolase (beta-lactamase superfamily II)
VLEHHPGPSTGSLWVIIPSEKVVFVGDAVTKGQPPFLANANFNAWIEAVNLLQGPAYKSYTVISGRGGLVNANAIKNQLDFLKSARDKLEKFSTKKKQTPAATEKVVTSLLSWYKAPAVRQKQYAQRLRYALLHYTTRSHRSSSRPEEE